MWRWLTDVFSIRNKSRGQQSGDRLVAEEDYDFKFGTKPRLPDALRDLKITTFRPSVLQKACLLEGFDIDLTVDQKYLDDTPERIAAASRCFRWAKSYHGLSVELRPPICLHRANVLLTDSRPTIKVLTLWLEKIGWPLERPVAIQEATTAKPLEDGYFTCLRLTAEEVADDTGLSWKPKAAASNNSIDILHAFIQRELVKPWGPDCDEHYSNQNCEGYLLSCYADTPKDQLTHPVFALIDYPTFDNGCVESTFAGSMWSKSELLFWSRPTYFHK